MIQCGLKVTSNPFKLMAVHVNSEIAGRIAPGGGLLRGGGVYKNVNECRLMKLIEDLEGSAKPTEIINNWCPLAYSAFHNCGAV